MKEKTNKGLSKFLSLVLRHKPETIGISLDSNGWVKVSILLGALNKKSKNIDRQLLEEIVNTNDKKRFAFNEDKTMIRASQGHSVDIDLGLESVVPPENLFHGTASKNADSIFNSGLQKRGRNHVHLSLDKETAVKVGMRHGTPVVLTIMSGDMHRDGIKFYLSENGVYLVDAVDMKYIRFINSGI